MLPLLSGATWLLAANPALEEGRAAVLLTAF